MGSQHTKRTREGKYTSQGPLVEQEPALKWYLKSMGDRDTHLGRLYKQGDTYQVQALCGEEYEPVATMVAQGLGKNIRLERGPLALPGTPADPDQICWGCRAP